MKATLIDTMGDDLRVVNAARVSFNKESEWERGQIDDGGACSKMGNILSEKDQRLISYLASHNHWTPFSHVMITMREDVPIFVARQRFKHMVGFTYNEVSRRYVDDSPEFYIPDVWRKRAENAKQGSSDEEIIVMDIPWETVVAGVDEQGAYYDEVYKTVTISDEYQQFIHTASELYETMIKAGIAPEQARMVLPQSMYTSYYVTGSLAAWARAYKLRIDPHAQKEICDLAEQWGQIFDSIPSLHYSWKALTQ